MAQAGVVAVGVVTLLIGAHALAATPPTIGIEQFKYGPSMLTVPVGTTVTWVNHEPSTRLITQRSPVEVVLLSRNDPDTDSACSSRSERCPKPHEEARAVPALTRESSHLEARIPLRRATVGGEVGCPGSPGTPSLGVVMPEQPLR